jgi:hypothetical protein
MTDIETRYLLERAAGAAEACVELDRPEFIRDFILDGYDGAGVRQALSGATTPVPAAAARVRTSPRLDTNTDLAEAAAQRFAAQASGTPQLS